MINYLAETERNGNEVDKENFRQCMHVKPQSRYCLLYLRMMTSFVKSRKSKEEQYARNTFEVNKEVAIETR